ncbi:hypothetical protein Tsp_11841, partial [Trichinella spiralis]|uniref:hypothetical protein n=1 Tax=Trichinella spiralis TaxID=6334 RepID=UPI0001EFE16E
MLSYQTWALSSERCAANEQWRFQCDDSRRRAIKTALYRRMEDKRRHPEDKAVSYRAFNTD